MLVIVVMLTVIGMVMDPFGAVILVSATIAQPAIRMGIDPLHFWIVCLVAFELGYLSPPVALNHLLTRQVVGETEVLAAERTGSFWHRYERLLLPLAVMGPTLLLVAFVPMLFYAL
jgi:TRAP-type C4-dicarboxylate transport system permease large subunit